MGLIKNIKSSIDENSSMSVGSVTALASAFIGVIIGFVVCFILIYDVTQNGYVKTDLDSLGVFLLSSGAYILGSSAPKAYVDARIKKRAAVRNKEMEWQAEDKYGRRSDLMTPCEDVTEANNEEEKNS